MSSISLNLSTNSTLETQSPRRDSSILTVIGGLTLTSFNGLLGSDEEDMENLNDILTLTILNCLLVYDMQDSQNQKGILTLTSLNGLLGSD